MSLSSEGDSTLCATPPASDFAVWHDAKQGNVPCEGRHLAPPAAPPSLSPVFLNVTIKSPLRGHLPLTLTTLACGKMIP